MHGSSLYPRDGAEILARDAHRHAARADVEYPRFEILRRFFRNVRMYRYRRAVIQPRDDAAERLPREIIL